MKTQLIVAAFMLLGGIKFSSAKAELVPQAVISFPMEAAMTQQTEVILIEDHAAPAFNLTLSEAWAEYHAGEISIVELVPDQHYIIKRHGVEIDVVMDME